MLRLNHTTEPAAEFDRLVMLDGGRLDVDAMPEGTRQRAVKIQSRFEHVVEHVREVAPDHAQAWARSLRLDWVADATVNGIAVAGAKHCHVGLYAGVLDQLFHVCTALASHPLHFKEVPGALSISPYDAAVSWSKTLASLIRRELNQEIAVKLVEFLNSNSPRVKIADALYAAAVDFMIMHEIHHFWCGHVFAFDGPRRLGLTARPSKCGAVLDPPLRRALERHADIFAVRRIFEALAYQEDLDRKVFTHVWLTAVSLLFMTSYPNPPTYDTWIETTYPHPHNRFFEIAARTEPLAKQHFLLSDRDWEDVFEAWIRDVVQIENWGGGVQSPFLQVLAAQESNNCMDIEMTDSLKAAMSGLQQAQDDMCAYFSQAPT